MNNKNLSKESKAEYYIDTIMLLLDFLENLASEMGYICYIYYYNDDDYGSGGEGGSVGLYEQTKIISEIKTEPFKVLYRADEKPEWQGGNKNYYKNATKITNEFGGELYLVPESFEINKYCDPDKPNKNQKVIAPFEEFSNFHFLDEYFYKDTNKELNGEERTFA